MNRSNVILALSALLVCIVMPGSVFAGAESCTPATCGTGPVMVGFQYSNCSGAVTYRPIHGENGVCSGGSKRSWNDVAYYDYYAYSHDDGVCDPSVANVTYRLTVSKFGACQRSISKRASAVGCDTGRRTEFSAMEASFMILLNVNASYISPQTFTNDQTVPEFSHLNGDCYSVNNCSKPNGEAANYWSTYYSGYNCQGPVSSTFNVDQQFGVCENFFGQMYSKSFCSDASTTYMVYYEDSACSSPIVAELFRSVCSNNQHSATFCTATPTPLPTFKNAEPASPAPSPMQWSVFVIASALLSAVLAF